MDYFELIIDLKPRDPWAEILVAQLAEVGFESFVDTENGIMAYAPVSMVNFDNPVENTFLDINEFKVDCEATWQHNIIPKQNWNELWEKDFHPVNVDDLVTIYAPFHDASCVKGIGVEILPKMSFGTGHHQTTYLMSKALFDFHPFPKKVLDMGTGTGVLAIIAEKLGANNVLAVDIEPWSVENTIENAERNNCQHIKAICGDIDVLEEDFYDLILANINKNVLKTHIPHYSKKLVNGGTLLLSGFFNTDVDELQMFAQNHNFKVITSATNDTWALLKMTKN
jgi:ribosomal protein L11 methyltransferase